MQLLRLRKGGIDTLLVCKLDREIAYGHGIKELVWHAFTWGNEHTSPRSASDLNHPEYQQLWDQLVSKGYEPFIHHYLSGSTVSAKRVSSIAINV